MKKNFLPLVLSLTAVMLFSGSAWSADAAPAPSSEIPAKREFPLNPAVNPCEDFHEYVCSKAEAAFKLRDDRSSHTFSFNDSSERILEAKKEFFAGIQKQKNLSARAKQIKDNYLACMNDKAGAENEQKELKRMLGEVRALKSAGEFAAYQLKQLREGRPGILNFFAYSNQDNPKVNDAFVMVELMNLPEHSYYQDEKLMADYRRLVIEFFRIAEPELNEKQLADKADRMIRFEKDFVKTYPLPEVRRQRWSEKRQETRKDFVAKYAQIGVAPLLNPLPQKTLMSNPVPEALDFYNQALTDENLPVLQDFFLYSFGSSVLDDSNPAYFAKQFDFNHTYLGGPAKRSERDERCTRRVMYAFPKELDQLLIKKMFPHFPTAKFKNVAQQMRESIIRGLKSNTWLEPETKAKAVLKIEKAKLYLVQPENAKEWDFLPVQRYSSVNRFENSRIYNKAVLEKNLKSLKDGANLEAWDMGPLTVNAYYDPSANKFVMPMGILQYPFFNAEGDLIENLGAVGAVIGHELGHGVDDQGSRYDEKGQLKQWMTMRDLKEFSNRSSRLIAQFNKAGHNGQLTLGENIGDLVGLTFAYQAAFPDGKAKEEDQRKLFIAYGRLWCEVNLPKAEEQQLKTDPHALGRARINEQVKHQKAFADAFHCKKGDKMTLQDEDRVKIW